MHRGIYWQLKPLAGDQFLNVGLGLVQQVVATIACIAERRNQIAGLERHVELEMGDVFGKVFAGFGQGWS
jgi:hypothetical protein